MSHKAKNKKDNKKKEKLLLDTSIQIKKLTSSVLLNELERLRNEGRELNSSFFVLYEFKAGFIATLIEYYLFIKLHTDFPESISAWSNKSWSIRQLKFIKILDSLMLKVGSINKDKNKYLNQVEAVIYHLVANFGTDLKNMVGDFQADEMVKYEILDRDDFKGFLDKKIERNKCIPLVDFWTKHSEDLDKMLAGGDTDYKTDGLKKIYDKLVKIKQDIQQCDMQRINNSIGDAVIAADCPLHYTLASLDHSFEVLCGKVGKKYMKFS